MVISVSKQPPQPQARSGAPPQPQADVGPPLWWVMVFVVAFMGCYFLRVGVEQGCFTEGS